MQFGKLFPRMFIGVTAGLIDGRHHKRMGAAWMLFAWCCMRQTGQGEDGIVCGGAVVTYAQIAEEMNCKRGSVREWMRRLVEEKYIRVERDRRGIRIFVRNPKKFRVWKVQHSKPLVSVETSAGRVSEPQHSKPIHAVENTATYENLLRSNLTKLPKNNNTTADATCASDVILLFRDAAMKLKPQTRPVQERQRLLHQQAKMILEKYSPGWRKAVTA